VLARTLRNMCELATYDDSCMAITWERHALVLARGAHMQLRITVIACGSAQRLLALIAPMLGGLVVTILAFEIGGGMRDRIVDGGRWRDCRGGWRGWQGSRRASWLRRRSGCIRARTYDKTSHGQCFTIDATR
jgi:hypothetical protein